MFIRATRQVNWNLHLTAFRAMLPWFFIWDGINYARYDSAYMLEMTALEKTHPGTMVKSRMLRMILQGLAVILLRRGKTIPFIFHIFHIYIIDTPLKGLFSDKL